MTPRPIAGALCCAALALCAGCTVKRLPLDDAGGLDGDGPGADAPGADAADAPDVPGEACAADERAQLLRAAARAAALVSRGAPTRDALTRCLLDATFSPGDHGLAELIAGSAAAFFTERAAPWPDGHLRCVGPAEANAVTIGLDGVAVQRRALAPAPDVEDRLAASFVAAAAVAQMERAELRVDEIRGSAGQSVYETAFSVRAQTARCALGALRGDARPSGEPRSSMDIEVELQPIGGDDGSPFLSGCIYPLTNLSVAHDEVVTRVEMRCGTMVTAVGVSGAAPTPMSCPLGAVVTGVRGVYTVARVLRMIPRCAPIAEVRARRPVTPTEPVALVSPPRFAGTHEYVRDCPTGLVLHGFHGRLELDLREPSIPKQLRPICGRPQTVPLPFGSTLAVSGAFHRERARRDFCTDVGLMVGLHGQLSAPTGDTPARVVNVGAICRGARHDAAWALREDGEDHVTPARGPVLQGAVAFSEAAPAGTRCPDGEVMVGLFSAIAPDGTLGALEGRCARPDAWTAAGAPPTGRTARFGDPALPGDERTCTNGRYLVGLEVHRGPVAPFAVSGIYVLCRALPAGGI